MRGWRRAISAIWPAKGGLVWNWITASRAARTSHMPRLPPVVRTSSSG